jgi:uncharacterized protein YjhX (UPF0386 family)
MKKRFSYSDNGACLIIHDDLTGINRASCYCADDAEVICNTLENFEKKKKKIAIKRKYESRLERNQTKFDSSK